MNRLGKSIDKTFLSVDNAEKRGFIHRDYIAHCLRWSHVAKCLGTSQAYKTARILDIGCGKEAPFAKLLYSSRMFPALYEGVDAGKIEYPSLGKYEDQAFWYPNRDICTLDKIVDCTHIVCFEVLEHVEPDHCVRILQRIKSALAPDGTAFISTPNWDEVHCAGNHVNEMKYETLGYIMEREGFYIEAAYGTFASIRDYKEQLAPEHRALFKSLRRYYDTNMLSCIFAPLYPSQSRNCLWKLKSGPGYAATSLFPEMPDGPWSSSERWREFEPDNAGQQGGDTDGTGKEEER